MRSKENPFVVLRTRHPHILFDRESCDIEQADYLSRFYAVNLGIERSLRFARNMRPALHDLEVEKRTGATRRRAGG